MNEQVIAKAEEILLRTPKKERGVCVLALIDAEGYPSAATISPSIVDGIRRIAFGTGIDSNWAKRIAGCNRASVCFNSAPEQYNITLVGTISVLTDDAARRAVWYPGLGFYFSGPDDPNFCVLEFVTRRYSLMLGAKGSAGGTL